MRIVVPPLDLITICFSHYNERARWALAHHGIAVREHRYMPLFHVPAVRRATGGRGGRSDAQSSRFSTPVLHGGGADGPGALTDSSEIVAWADAQCRDPQRTLYPAEHRNDIEALEAKVSGRFGGDTRRVAYHVALGNREMMAALARHNVGPSQIRAWRLLGPVVGRMIRRGLGIEAQRALRSMQRVESLFAELSEQLEGRQFLFGERFTAADLTFAAMAAPVLLPQVGYGAWLPAPESIEHPLRERLFALRDARAGVHALRMYADFRPSSPEPAAPQPPPQP